MPHSGSINADCTMKCKLLVTPHYRKPSSKLRPTCMNWWQTVTHQKRSRDSQDVEKFHKTEWYIRHL